MLPQFDFTDKNTVGLILALGVVALFRNAFFKKNDKVDNGIGFGAIAFLVVVFGIATNNFAFSVAMGAICCVHLILSNFIGKGAAATVTAVIAFWFFFNGDPDIFASRHDGSAPPIEISDIPDLLEQDLFDPNHSHP